MNDYLTKITIDEIMEIAFEFSAACMNFMHNQTNETHKAVTDAELTLRTALQRMLKLERLNYAGCMVELEQLERTVERQRLIAEVVNGKLMWCVPEGEQIPEWVLKGKHLLYAEKP